MEMLAQPRLSLLNYGAVSIDRHYWLQAISQPQFRFLGSLLKTSNQVVIVGFEC